ncbi:unnamed protein product, partial [Rotaria magnacalcarata]
TCLNTYCQEATDKQEYDDLVKYWHECFEIESIGLIDTPPALSNIVEFAEELNPYAASIAWKTYLDQQTAASRNNRSLERNPIERQLREELDNDTSRQEEEFSTDVIQESINNKVKMESIAILKEAKEILKQFKQILQHICERGRRIPIENILRLFPDINQAQNDLETLAPLLIKDILPLLRSITSFWKDRIRIRSICTGIMNLSSKISVDIDPSFLRSLNSIDQRVLSEQCSSIYEQYLEDFERKCSANVLTLFSFYGSSQDLFEFLDSLAADDVYNLQEAVNDWDETLVNTKTIFDFSTVKNFLDRAYASISEKQKQLNLTSLSFDRIIGCFEDILTNKEFNDLAKCLQSSALSLASIKRIHLELTDKEQSKRRRIADILQSSNIEFVRIGHHEVAFDIYITLQNHQEQQQKQTTMNEEQKIQNITFADISELRDRARLLEYSSNTQESDKNQHDVDKLRHFIQFVSVVETTLETLTNLYRAGYPLVSTNEGILRAILSLFQKTNTPPHIRHLFYCTTQTNWIQIRAFIYRCFYSKSFHQLIRPELLSQSIQDQFVCLLRSLIKEKPDQYFRIGIITTTNIRNQQLINGLRSMRIVDILRDQNLLNRADFEKLIQDMNKNCTLVTSRISGLGKSTFIRKAIETSNVKYVKFPIYGDFDIDTLAERLRSKYSQLETGAIHLDIGTTANSQQLNEVLYCLLLFRNFRFGQVAVSIPTTTMIYIEFDASPDANFSQLPLFQYITPSAVVEKVDWTTLNIEYGRNCRFLLPYFIEPQLRMDLAQALLQSSNLFTSLSVENVRKQQRSATSGEPMTFSDAIVQWDKIQPFTLAFTASNDPLFIYKKPTDVPQALVKYFKLYYDACGQSSVGLSTMFPDYNKLIHSDFFVKSASLSYKYFNKSICPKCFGQYDLKQVKCDKCASKDLLIRPKSFDSKDIEIFQRDIAKRLQDDYVLTSDNFIKMLLIYLRVQCGIPVLIMGETGCGKTSLIKFLCQKILDEDLEIFRIHAGVTADIIINKMNAYIKKVQAYTDEEKRLWIFFDEFNTTTNIGLLKEI